MMYDVFFDVETYVATVAAQGTEIAGEKVGEFEHPDPVYPGSVVVFHKVRDVLYKCSAEFPENPAMFPDNITDMQRVTIIVHESDVEDGGDE